MHSLTADYLAKLRFDARQLVTLRALGEYRGKQQLYVAQSHEVLSDLSKVAVVESTESSNRLEGVVVVAHRLKSLVLKNATPQSRSEQEVAGYRDALGLIHESGDQMPFSEGTALQLHGMLYRPAGIGKPPTTTSSNATPTAARASAFAPWPRTSRPWRWPTWLRATAPHWINTWPTRWYWCRWSSLTSCASTLS
jgi:hypothetical protein